MESRSILVDTHCHLDADEYDAQEPLLERAIQVGVGAVVAVGSSLESSLAVLELGRKYVRRVLPAAGLHPELERWERDEPEKVMDLIREFREELAGIGEIGLPYYSVKDGILNGRGRAEREEWFERFVELAEELDLPLLLHTPHSAAEQALTIIQSKEIGRAVFHWHKAPPEVTEAIIQAGYYISVTPEVCYRERDRNLVKMVPLGNLLLETDGPWPFQGEFSGRRTEPLLVARLAQEVALLKGATFEEIAERTTANALNLLGQKEGQPRHPKA